LARRDGGVRLLQMSSGSVYGPQSPDIARLDESHPTAATAAEPAERFGAAKRRAEQAGEVAVSRGVHVVIARAFAVVGPRLPLDAGFALGNFLGDARAGRTVTLSSDGTVQRSWIHLADLAVWSWTLLLRGRPGRAYNVGSEEAWSLWDAAHRVAALPVPPVAVQRLREPSPGLAPSRYIPAIARAHDELGLEAWIPFDEAIRRTWRWLRTSPS
jgi:dTDP-glucose 4,6-dehydratase